MKLLLLISVIAVFIGCASLEGQAPPAPSSIITTVAGNGTYAFSGDGGPATLAALNLPVGVAVDASGNLFIADSYNNRIRKVSPSGIISTVAGSGNFGGYNSGGFSGDGGPATSASLSYPTGVVVDASGSLLIADTLNDRIRRVSPSGIIMTVAGNGAAPNGTSCSGNPFCGGFSGDGGPATSAALWNPMSVAVDASGNLFIADTVNNRIRKVSSSGIITTVAGNGIVGCYGFGCAYFSGDGGPATSASLSYPTGVVVDASGSLFIADDGNNRIRKVSPSGIITTVAGNGDLGFSGDGGPATSASLAFSVDNVINSTARIAVDASGNLFIADDDNNRIREVSPSGIITTVAGNGPSCLKVIPCGRFSGDEGPPTSASLNSPIGVAVDASGNLFIADSFNSRIREVLTVNALGGIQNAASYATGAVSPGEIVVLYGAGMGPAALATLQVDSGTGLLETTVAGTTVLFNGVPATIVYTSADQVSVIVPYEVAGAGTADILVNYQGKNVAASAVTIAPSAPGIFTVGSGTGQAAALNQDGPVNSVSNPAAAGSTIVLYLTGEGQTTPPGVDGEIASAAPYPAPVLPVTVTIGGQTTTYSYAGAAPDEVAGVMQINAVIPAGVTGNAVPVSVQIGTVSTQNGATIAVQ